MDLSLAAAQAASKCQKVEAADTAPAVIRVRKWHQGPCQINAPARIILLGQLSLYFLLSFSVFWKFPHELGLEVICPYSHDSCFLFCPPDFWVLFFLLIFFLVPHFTSVLSPCSPWLACLLALSLSLLSLFPFAILMHPSRVPAPKSSPLSHSSGSCPVFPRGPTIKL